MDKDALANNLLLQSLVDYLIKTEVIDGDDYEKYLQIIKSASVMQFEGDTEAQDAVNAIFNEHISLIEK